MIELLVYIRFVFLWSILIAISMTIYFGLRHYVSTDEERFRTKFIMSGIAIFGIPVFILLYNALLASIILNDIKNKVNLATQYNEQIYVNGEETEITIGQVNNLLESLNFWNYRSHTHNLDGYTITINPDKNSYKFTFFRDSGRKTKFFIYTNQYNYELELASVNTKIFD